MPVVCHCGGPALAAHALLSIASDRPIPQIESLIRSGVVATGEAAESAVPRASEMPSAVELVIGLAAVVLAAVALVFARSLPVPDRPWSPAGVRYPPPAPPPRRSSLATV